MISRRKTQLFRKFCCFCTLLTKTQLSTGPMVEGGFIWITACWTFCTNYCPTSKICWRLWKEPIFRYFLTEIQVSTRTIKERKNVFKTTCATLHTQSTAQLWGSLKLAKALKSPFFNLALKLRNFYKALYICTVNHVKPKRIQIVFAL